MRHVLIVSVLAASLLAACNRQDQAPAPVETMPAVASTVAAPVSAEAPVVPQAVISKTDALWAEPSALDCGKPGKVTLHWNASSQSGLALVDIFAVSPKGEEKLFTTQKPVGQRDTGSWMRAGSQLILRDKNGGREIARIVVDGSGCPKPAVTANDSATMPEEASVSH